MYANLPVFLLNFSLQAFDKEERKCKIYVELYYQCCGSMTFWCGSGSGSTDPCLLQKDLDPDSAIFVIPSRLQQKTNFFEKVLLIVLFEGTFIAFLKDNK
jgi:hypothetical protein